MFYCYFISFILSWTALSCYWKNTEDMYWYNWFMHGFGIGMALLPMYWLGITLDSIFIRATVLGLSFIVLSKLLKNPWEEIGRGALIILTVFILRI